MKKYKENMENKDIVFEKRKQEQINLSKKSNDNVEVSELAETMSRVDPWTERKQEENNEIVN